MTQPTEAELRKAAALAYAFDALVVPILIGPDADDVATLAASTPHPSAHAMSDGYNEEEAS